MHSNSFKLCCVQFNHNSGILPVFLFFLLFSKRPDTINSGSAAGIQQGKRRKHLSLGLWYHTIVNSALKHTASWNGCQALTRKWIPALLRGLSLEVPHRKHLVLLKRWGFCLHWAGKKLFQLQKAALTKSFLLRVWHQRGIYFPYKDRERNSGSKSASSHTGHRTPSHSPQHSTAIFNISFPRIMAIYILKHITLASKT